MKKLLFRFLDHIIGHKPGRIEGNATHIWTHCTRCGKLLGPVTRQEFDKALGMYVTAIRDNLFPPVNIKV